MAQELDLGASVAMLSHLGSWHHGGSEVLRDTRRPRLSLFLPRSFLTSSVRIEDATHCLAVYSMSNVIVVV